MRLEGLEAERDAVSSKLSIAERSNAVLKAKVRVAPVLYLWTPEASGHLAER